jgi:SNF2 family DNA or RNA helicase
MNVLRGSVEERDGSLILRSPFAWAAKARALPGAQWDPDEKVWMYPDTPTHREMIQTAFGPMLAGGRLHNVGSYRQVPTYRNDPIPVTKTEPWQHQREAYWFIQNKPAAALFMDMGTGKSKVVVDDCNNHHYRRILILCPLSVIPAWEKQFDTHGARDYLVRPLQDNYTAQKKASELSFLHGFVANMPLVVLVNYESAWRDPLMHLLLAIPWDLVVLDEGHRIKTHKGRASQFCADLGKVAKKRLLLTGTPMPHSPLDIYAQYRFLDPTIFGPSYWPFEHRYAVKGGFDNKQVVAFKHLEELHDKMYQIAYRVEADDVLDLPAVQHVERTFLLAGAGAKHYRRLERDFITEVETGAVTASNALVKILRLQQLTSGFLQADSGIITPVHTDKEAVLKDIMHDTAVAEPFVVFCRFHHDLDRVREVANQLGRQTSELSGRTNDLARWQSGETAVLAVQWQAGGVGVDLSRARYCVMFSHSFSLGDYEQALKRVHRPGQTRPVTYYHLIAENTVDRQIYDALSQKRDVVDAVLTAARRGG